MNEVIQCASCQRKLSLPDTLIGQEVQCPTCGARFTAQGAGDAPPSREPASHARELPSSEPPRYDDDRGERRRRYADYDDDYGDEGDDFRRMRRRDLAPHRGGTILTLGILSIVFSCVIIGPMAWVMGNTDLAEIRAGRMDPEGEGLTRAGQICGIIGTIFGILACLYFLAVGAMIGAVGRF